MENDTDLPKIVLACATPRCNLVFSWSKSIELSDDFVRDVCVSSTWELFDGGSLDGSWIGFVVFTLCFMLIDAEVGSEEQKEQILVVRTRIDDFGGAGIVNWIVPDEIIIFFLCPCENPICIENSILSYFF